MSESELRLDIERAAARRHVSFEGQVSAAFRIADAAPALLARIERAEGERDAALAKLAAIEKLHKPVIIEFSAKRYRLCPTCQPASYAGGWPCPTVAVLGAVGEDEKPPAVDRAEQHLRNYPATALGKVQLQEHLRLDGHGLSEAEINGRSWLDLFSEHSRLHFPAVGPVGLGEDQ